MSEDEEKASQGFKKEDLNREGLATLDIENKEEWNVVRLGGQIVIDARDKPTPQRPKGYTDRGELAKLEAIFQEVRTAFASGENMNIALLNKMRKLGFDVKEAMVIGKAPEHWKPTNDISRQFVRRR